LGLHWCTWVVYVGVCEGGLGRLGCVFVLFYSILYVLYSILYIKFLYSIFYIQESQKNRLTVSESSGIV